MCQAWLAASSCPSGTFTLPSRLVEEGRQAGKEGRKSMVEPERKIASVWASNKNTNEQFVPLFGADPRPRPAGRQASHSRPGARCELPTGVGEGKCFFSGLCSSFFLFLFFLFSSLLPFSLSLQRTSVNYCYHGKAAHQPNRTQDSLSCACPFCALILLRFFFFCNVNVPLECMDSCLLWQKEKKKKRQERAFTPQRTWPIARTSTATDLVAKWINEILIHCRINPR